MCVFLCERADTPWTHMLHVCRLVVPSTSIRAPNRLVPFPAGICGNIYHTLTGRLVLLMILRWGRCLRPQSGPQHNCPAVPPLIRRFATRRCPNFEAPRTKSIILKMCYINFLSLNAVMRCCWQTETALSFFLLKLIPGWLPWLYLLSMRLWLRLPA